jgi:predicted transcriptional regulator
MLYCGQTFSVTVSIGVVDSITARRFGNVEDIKQLVDGAMYQAKLHGRDVVVYVVRDEVGRIINTPHPRDDRATTRSPSG